MVRRCVIMKLLVPIVGCEPHLIALREREYVAREEH
jgi:hypothetical protein